MIKEGYFDKRRSTGEIIHLMKQVEKTRAIVTNYTAFQNGDLE